MEGVVASWLVRSSPERAVQVRTLGEVEILLVASCYGNRDVSSGLIGHFACVQTLSLHICLYFRVIKAHC